MEIFRTLGALVEPPGPKLAVLAEALELGPLPAEVDHTELFTFQLYPYASVYLDAEGKLGGEARDRIAGFWRVLGGLPPAEPDHLTVMLAFYAELGERHEEGRRSAAGSGEERWRRVRKTFLWEHLWSWLPAYLWKLGDLAPPFYRRWGALLAEALAEDAARLGQPDLLPLHLRQTPALTDPRQGAPEAFLDGLLSPARSGLILTRSDLARAADELGLGLRMGERKYILKALLAQDATATLRWLASEAGRWAERHRGSEGLARPIARFWRSRAESTAALAGELAEV